MSTVALRGILAYDPQKKEWSWEGKWVFGDCVPITDTSADAVSSNNATNGSNIVAKTAKSNKNKFSPNKKQDTPQPFLYTWQEASDPSKVAVPSLNVKIIGADEREEDNAKLAVSNDTPSTPKASAEAENDGSNIQKEVLPSPNELALDGSKNGMKTPLPKNSSVETTTTPLDQMIAEKVTSVVSTENPTKTETTKIIQSPPSSTAQVRQSPSNTDVRDEKDARVKDENETTETTVTKTSNERTSGAPTPSVIKVEEKNHVEELTKKTDTVSSQDLQNRDAVQKNATSNDPKNSNERSTENVSEESKLSTTATGATSQESKPSGTNVAVSTKITFASVMPKFVDAADQYNTDSKNITPLSGLWKGYFQNVIKGKRTGRGRGKQTFQIQKVDETFYLFLNATPSSTEHPNSFSGNNSGASGDNIANGDISEKLEKNISDMQHNPSVDLFAFTTATKDHILKILNSKSECDPSLKETVVTSSPNTDASVGTQTKRNLVQVRGCGENEFGTFEIIGYLDLNTMVMEIQRQYVVTEISVASPSNKRRRSSPNSATLNEGCRPHSTRKRNPTWKRADYDPDEDRRRKRNKLLAHKQTQGSPLAIDPTTGNPNNLSHSNGTTFIHTSPIPFMATSKQGQPLSSETSMQTSGMRSGSIISALNTASGGRNSKSRLVLPTQSKNVHGSTVNASTVNASGRRSSTGGRGTGQQTKRRSSSLGKSASGSASTKSGSTYIRLPAVGDPKKARWRAAHFLYYQRDDPEQRAQQQLQSDNGANPNSANEATVSPTKVTPPKPKYVIYEGEMVDSKREGRGICLYTDGTLYEGEWRRNMEHGFGKLMSSDRKKIIYEGEWERGKMQGTGTYYYGSSDPLQLGSRYTGEFKENLRYGMGRYFLADGSIYDGQWRDGVMNGLGVFTWPDSSMYGK